VRRAGAVDEGILNFLYVAFGLLFWIGPLILRALAKKRRARKLEYELPEQPEPQAPPAPVPAPAARYGREPQAAAPVPPPSAVGQFDAIVARVARGEERAGRLWEKCGGVRGIGGELAAFVEEHIRRRLTAISDRLRSRSPDDAMRSDGISRMSKEIGRIERRMSFVEAALSRRSAVSDSVGMEAMDRALQDLSSPYAIHARRMEIPVYPIAEMMVPVGLEGFDSSLPDCDISAFRLDIALMDRPRDWPLLARETAATFLGAVPGVTGGVAAGLSLPDPIVSMGTFYATGRLTTDTLMSGWLRHLLPDILATIQMGPSYVESLARVLEEGGVDQVPMAAVDSGLVLGPPPDHLRIFTACAVLGGMGFEAEGAGAWDRWSQIAGAPDAVMLQTGRFPMMPIPVAVLQVETNELVSKALTAPLGQLGGYPLAAVPDLACDGRRAAAMRSAAEELREGTVPRVEPRTILGAASLAAAHDNVLESRIAKVARGALVAGGTQEGGGAAASSADPRGFRESLSSPEMWVKAVATGAILTPRRWGSAG